MIVENAKQHIAIAVKTDTHPPYADVNPLMVSSAPAASPYPIETPLHKITSAVSVMHKLYHKIGKIVLYL